MATEPGADHASSAIITVPNLISTVRILLIPVYVALIVGERTEVAGILLFAAVVATDWVDGTIARRTGRVSEVGKMLDPIADRLAIAAGLIALVIAGAFPPWAALLILVRDAGIVIGGAALVAVAGIRIEVRFIGKVATLGLMVAIPWIAWGHFDVPFAPTTTTLGWIMYGVAIVEYYLAALLYIGDARRALERRATLPPNER
jgi:cardiolipin synthase (CMP-forming)